MTSPVPDRSKLIPSVPRGEEIGRFTSYLDAQKVVDFLADNDFDVSSVSIVGNDLKLVERVRSKLSYPRVALAGAAQGAMMGLFFGLLLMLFSQGPPSALPILAGLILGAVLWMIMGVVGYAMQRGQRDFSSTRQAVIPESWSVIVEGAGGAAARRLAESLPMNLQQAGRRSGWGSQAPVQPSGGGQPTVGAPLTPQEAAGQQGEQSAATLRPGYEDLDDGRPRFGARQQAGEPGPASTEPAAPAQRATSTEPAASTESAAPAERPERHASPEGGEAQEQQR